MAILFSVPALRGLLLADLLEQLLAPVGDEYGLGDGPFGFGHFIVAGDTINGQQGPNPLRVLDGEGLARRPPAERPRPVAQIIS